MIVRLTKTMVQQSTPSYVIGGTKFHPPPVDVALYIVATPIGNLGDITIRALETLAGVDIIACEDTRVTRILLERYAIKQKLISYHKYNQQTASPLLLDALQNGNSVALVSDAGTPLISDPGFHLIQKARTANIKIVPIPGASAILTALVSSGLPTENFFFDGFLSTKAGQRRKRLESLKALATTLIFYESPHRVSQTLQDMADILGAERKAALCRELTKLFEEIDCAPLHILAQKYGNKSRPRGEIVLVVAPPPPPSPLSTTNLDQLLQQAVQTMSPARAAAQVALATGAKKQDLYQRLLSLKKT